MVARFNFSHGDHEEQKSRMDLLKQLREELHTNTAILLDTKGPEIRTGKLKDGKKVILENGASFTLTTEEIIGDATKVSITYTGLPEDVDKGSTILIDDGLIGLKVVSKTEKEIRCEVVNGGELGEKKGVNVPNVAVRLPAITEKDKDDIRFGVEQDIDFIAASFVRNAECVLEIKAYLKELELRIYRSSQRSRMQRESATLTRSSAQRTESWWQEEIWAWKSRLRKCHICRR